VYGVVWFGRSHEISSKGSVPGGFKVDPFVNNSEDIENSSARKQRYSIPGSVENTLVENTLVENTLPKATNSARRGIDPPFSRRNTCSNSSSPTISSLTLPSCPNKSVKSEVGSRFIETFRESKLLARPETSEHFVENQVHKDPFPSLVMDVDAPIPLPRLSEWVRADALKGISVHTNPHTSIA